MCICARVCLWAHSGRGPTRAATEEEARRSSRRAQVGKHGIGRRWARSLLVGLRGRGGGAKGSQSHSVEVLHPIALCIFPLVSEDLHCSRFKSPPGIRMGG